MSTSESKKERYLDCALCGYNLRGTLIDGACPECGTPVRQSIEFLRSAGSPQFVRHVLVFAMALAAAVLVGLIATNSRWRLYEGYVAAWFVGTAIAAAVPVMRVSRLWRHPAFVVDLALITIPIAGKTYGRPWGDDWPIIATLIGTIVAARLSHSLATQYRFRVAAGLSYVLTWLVRYNILLAWYVFVRQVRGIYMRWDLLVDSVEIVLPCLAIGSTGLLLFIAVRASRKFRPGLNQPPAKEMPEAK